MVKEKKNRFAAQMNESIIETNENIEREVQINTDNESWKNVKVIKLSKKLDNKNLKGTSLNLSESAADILKNKIIETNNNSVNVIIREFLEAVYDPKIKGFKVKIEAKPNIKKKTTPVQLPADILEALKIQAKIHNMTVGEYFSEIFIESFKK